MGALEKFKGRTAALLITFGTATTAVAQDAPRISEVINGIPSDINCTSAFPDGENPVDRFVAWVDTHRYHGGQTGPLQYALMSQQDRQEFWQTFGVNRGNMPLYNHIAQRYDAADDKVEELKRILSESPHFFPIERWDQMAGRCAGLD